MGKTNKNEAAQPKWARVKWFEEMYGISGYYLKKWHEEGEVRMRRVKKTGSSPLLFNVADALRVFEEGGDVR